MVAQVKPRPFIASPSVLVFKEKHGDRHFNVPDDEALFAAALKVLAERFKQGYWYYDPAKEGAAEAMPEAPDFTAEQVATMPESLRKAAYKKLRDYEVKTREH